MRTIVFSLLCLALTCLAETAARAASVVTSGHTRAELVAETEGVVPGQALTVALRLGLDPGWHTYWQNPGVSGEAANLAWTLPEGARAGDIRWPAPAIFRTGPLVTFGFEGEPWLLTTIAMPASLVPGESVRIGLDATWLVCADVCVPEQGRFDIDLPVLASAPPENAAAREGFARARAALPVPSTAEARFWFTGEKATVSVTDPVLAGLRAPLLFPAAPGLLSVRKDPIVRAGDGTLAFTFDAGPRAQSAEERAAVTDLPVVVTGGGTNGARVAYALVAKRGADGQSVVVEPALSWGLAILFALLGGALLNLMPCVFPVLSMKALALLRENDVAAARREGLAYAGGVIASFVALAVLLLIVRAGGAAVGWGFQLQSPAVVGALALLFVGIGFNLAGLVEIPGPALSVPGHTPLGRDFLMGCLAVVVATPCTAPFMAAALGAALTLEPPVALSVFAALGVGMAAPYVAMTSSPWLRRRIPRPGPWLTTLREALAFPMFATAVWLAWVLGRAAGPPAILLLGAGIVLLALAAWTWRRANGRAGFRAAALGALALALVSIAAMAGLEPPGNSAVGHASDEAYSSARLADLRTAGTPVFVNATAAWCITCQWNEQVTLSSREVSGAMRAHGVVWLTADWTRRAPDITALLEEHGRSGVPLYLLFVPGEDRARVLPQYLTKQTVLRELARLPAKK